MMRLVLEVGRKFDMVDFGKPRTFLRGVPYEIDSYPLYFYLFKTGRFVDPERVYNFIMPGFMYDLAVDKPSDIYVIRDCGLGDVLMLSPVLAEFQKKWSIHRIHFVTTTPFVPLFAGRPFVSSVLDYEKNVGSFPLAIDLVGYSERAEDRRVHHRVDVFSSYLGVNLPEWKRGMAEFAIDEKEKDWAKRELEARGVKEGQVIIGLEIRGATPVRTWPRINLSELSQLLVEAGYWVMLLDHETSMGWEEEGILNFCGKLTLRQVAALIGQTNAMVCPDSGLLHLAGALRVPTVGLFGTIPPELRIKYYPKTVAITAQGLECLPCFDNASCWENGEIRADCMKAITPQEVFAAVRKQLAN